MTAEVVLDDRERALVRLAASLTASETVQVLAMDEAVRIAPDAAEEVLLQSYLFLGFPVALNGLGLWRRRTGRPPPEPVEAGAPTWSERGEEVCRKVYAHQYQALQEVMEGIHPDLARWALEEGYGKVLGRPGLELPLRELCVAAMLSGIDASRQLHAHLRGCVNVGAPPAAVSAMLKEVEPIIGAARMAVADRIWQRVRSRSQRSERSERSEGPDGSEQDASWDD